jgi:tetratricopeptide (TPR) repeat protein
MNPLQPPDSHHIKAAEGWLGLGNWQEANEELERITPQNRAHSDVLEVRWEIYAKAKKWEECVDIAGAIIKIDPNRSEAWIHRSFALYELKRAGQPSKRVNQSTL